VTSIPFVSLTRATFLSAEFGFLGVTVRTWVQTPRFCGAPLPCRWMFFKEFSVKRIAGAFVRLFAGLLPFRIS
jgi:hypothetical protein